MERIQQAIEKARKHRGFGEAPDNLRRVFSPKRTAIDVEYTQTRKVDLDEQDLKARRIVGGLAHDPQSEPYRQLRAQVLQKMRANQWQTLGITSPVSGNGKTLSALNLAISLSQETNQTVLLVDVDLRTPSVAAMLGIQEVEFGIMDYLSNHEPLEHILINAGYSRLVILPGTPQGPYSSEILSSTAMQELHNELRSRYVDRIILYDLPPILSSDDALAFLPSVDAAIMIIEDGGCTVPQLERATKLIKDFPLLGTVLNKVR